MGIKKANLNCMCSLFSESSSKLELELLFSLQMSLSLLKDEFFSNFKIRLLL